MRSPLYYLLGFLEWLVYVIAITVSPKWRRLLREPKKPKTWWQEAGYKQPPAWSKYDGADRY